RISEKLQEKLDKNQCDKFMNALKKGIIYIYIDNKVITALNLSVKKQLQLKLTVTSVYSQIYYIQTNMVNY
ncbi:MAG: hypothetical protein O7C02_00290, partial [Rickettsia endosymbiont of Ixodes persulcatus]|nr:hypothetical protein [Rickettsia endosymbiont of Ixodes persulcatus]